MCGISFIFHSDGQAAQPSAIEAMINALVHRGPDAQHYSCLGPTALGHTRLSIVDVQGGAQPMSTPDGRFSIVFNGEIYNYHALRDKLQQQGVAFQTRSDTEVILQLFAQQGEACVPQLRGMFSFAIYDAQRKSLFVARDRFGIKPCFYHWDGSTLTGASEMKAIFASGLVQPAFNLQTLRNYFTYQFNITPYTCFQDVLQLPPGYTLTLAEGSQPRLNQYWDLDFPLQSDDDYSEQEWTEKFETALHDAAASHMIGEVPIGAYLSGGIDSSTTTYLLKQHYPETVHTFTMRFLNPASDESELAHNTARHLQVPSHDLIIDDERPGGYLDVLEQALYHVEQPQRMALEIPLYLLSGLVEQQHYKVVYTGDGADEIFGGYDCYRQDYIRINGNHQADEEARINYYLSEYLNDFSADQLCLLADLHQNDEQARTIKRFGCYPAWYDFWHILQPLPGNLLTDAFAEATQHDQQMDELVAGMKPRISGRHVLNQSLYIETKTRLPDWILWKTDRMTMAHGVEARVPFLDHPLVELCAQMPTLLKLRYMDEKYVLRKVMTPRLPEHPYAYKKRAFYTPIREWLFTAEHVGQLDPYVSEAALRESNLFQPRAVAQLLQDLVAAPAPQDVDSYYAVMKKEWLLMLILSIQILYKQFIKKESLCFQNSRKGKLKENPNIMN
jgi:asparagine synthase (glutamine-hydrolysing)